MAALQLYAVTPAGPQPLPTPTGALDLLDLYHDVELGVYSVLRTFEHNKFLHLADHLARTVQSMRLLGWKEGLDLPALRRTLHEICTAYPGADLRVRIDVLAAPAHALGTDSRLLVALMPFTSLPERYYEQGVAVGFAQGLTRQDPLIKRAEFAEIRRRAGIQTDVYENLLINDRGEILEGASSNFYGVRNRVLYTAGSGVLEGVTRHILLTLAQEDGMTVQLEPVWVEGLARLDEAALSSSARGLLPVVTVDGQSIGSGRPGPVCRRLMGLYAAYVARHIKTALEE